MGVITAERIKLTTVRSPWWCSAIVVVLGLGLAALFGWLASSTADATDPSGVFTADNSIAVGGVSGFGVMVLMILAALTVTSEYRFGVIRNSFLATPHRAKVLLAKAGLVSVLAAVLTLVLSIAAVFITEAIGGEYSTAGFEGAEALRQIYSVPVYAVLCVFLAVGVGALVRQSAGAISILLLWSLLLEPLLGAFGTFGRTVSPWLPFNNANQFLGAQVATDFHWGPLGSLLYFTAFVAVIFGAALFVVNKRDA